MQARWALIAICLAATPANAEIVSKESVGNFEVATLRDELTDRQWFTAGLAGERGEADLVVACRGKQPSISFRTARYLGGAGQLAAIQFRLDDGAVQGTVGELDDDKFIDTRGQILPLMLGSTKAVVRITPASTRGRDQPASVTEVFALAGIREAVRKVQSACGT